MNKLLTFFLTALLAFSVGWAEEVTTTISSANATGTTLTWSNSNLTFSLTEKPTSTSYSVETSNYARGLSTGAKTGTHVLTSDQSFSNVTKVEVVASLLKPSQVVQIVQMRPILLTHPVLLVEILLLPSMMKIKLFGSKQLQ